MEEKYQDYWFLPCELWGDLMSNFYQKGSRNSAGAQIKRLYRQDTAIEESDSNDIPRIPWNKKARTGVLMDRKSNNNKTPKHGGTQNYCVLYKKSWIIELKFKLHSSDTCIGKCSDQASLKEGLGGNLVNRDTDFKQFQKAENKCKSSLKLFKKLKNIFYSMYTCTHSQRELNNIKNIRSKVTNKYESSSSDIYSSDSDSHLSINSNLYSIIQPDLCK